MIAPIFHLSKQDYLYPDTPVADPKGQSAYLPIEIDTEFYHLDYDINRAGQFKRVQKTLTNQLRAIASDDALIFAHPDISDIARHPVFSTGFSVVDYLQALGHNASLRRINSPIGRNEYPVLMIHLYSFFTVAELFRIFTGEFLDDIKHITLHPGKQSIDQGRRTIASNTLHKGYSPWIELPWILTLNNYEYRVCISLFDTCAVHGNSSYKNFCTNSGLKLDYKDLFTEAEKADMYRMYIERPIDFDLYSIGDLWNYKALLMNAENFKLIYKSLGLEDYFTLPRLTIGATVANMIEASVLKMFAHQSYIETGYTKSAIIKEFCSYSTASWLKKKTTTTACYNSKVDGGRCRNNRPTDIRINGVICDTDISGCYGEGLRAQLYPLGKPVVLEYPINSPINDYKTLRQFLKKYGKELVPGLWQARVSTKEGYVLKYPQDFIVSWIPPKDISKMITDSEAPGAEEWWNEDNVGLTKIFTNEVHLGLIQHDFVQWLDEIATSRQRKELLDNLMVVTALFYPKSERVDNVEQLVKCHQTHTGKNTATIKAKKQKTTEIMTRQECHSWYGINVGEMLVNLLLIERKKHPKESPLNILYKLCINTAYGDFVSQFFKISNVCVGNNITARARALAWYMEKGLYGFQTITDGCAFDLNNVLYPKNERKVTGESTVNLYTKNEGYNHPKKPLGDVDYIEITPIKVFNDQKQKYELKGCLVLYQDSQSTFLSFKQTQKWLDTKVAEHLRNLFPNVDVLHQVTKDVYGNERIGQFEFEAKGIYNSAAFHGTANYVLSLENENKVRMRSYTPKEHTSFELAADDLQVLREDYHPSNEFLAMLQENPQRVKRSEVYINTKILKIRDWRRNYSSWQYSEAFPGCTVENAALLRELSLSQFTFQTHEQYKAWSKEADTLRRRHGQSYEMFFVDEEGYLDYQRLVNEVDAAIRAGKMSFLEGTDKRQSNFYRRYQSHPQLPALETAQLQLGERNGYVVEKTASDLIQNPDV
jgi:hypothetical protein